MKLRNLSIHLLMLVMLGWMLSACTPAQPAPVSAPVELPSPTVTANPPTATNLPPTDTAIPATEPPAAPSATVLPQTPGPVVTPSARAYHAMTYDTTSKRVILFGGVTRDTNLVSSPNFETWSFDPSNNTWKLMSPATQPEGSLDGEMVYDSKADRAILVVGAKPQIKGSFDNQVHQTWAYDYNQNTWTRLADLPSLNTLGPGLVYDSQADKLILFGGASVLGDYKLFNDTWVYDYTTNKWTQMHPANSPVGMNYRGMDYDPKADRVVLWGGDENSASNSSLETTTFTWAYDYNSNTWNEISTTNKPSASYYNNLVYADKHDLLVLYGGLIDGSNETWSFDMNTRTWQKLNPDKNPGNLSRYAMVYSPDIDGLILFGGQVGPTASNKFSSDTWIYSFSTQNWTKVPGG